MVSVKKVFTPAERLIVAADFKPAGDQDVLWVREQVIALARVLKGTGVYLKVNSALRAGGYDLIDEIRSHGLKVFADLKLMDIKETLATDGALLRAYRPEILTAMCAAHVDALRALSDALPETEVLGVTVLTTLKEAEVRDMHRMSVLDAVGMFGQIAHDSGIGGLISAPVEVEMLRARFGHSLTLNTPGVRPTWHVVAGDDQNPERVMTPAKAIKAGADRLVVGRPIVQAAHPYDAAMRTIDEIAVAAN